MAKAREFHGRNGYSIIREKEKKKKKIVMIIRRKGKMKRNYLTTEKSDLLIIHVEFPSSQHGA